MCWSHKSGNTLSATIYPIFQIIQVQSSLRVKEFKKILIPNSSDDLCLLLLSLSFFYCTLVQCTLYSMVYSYTLSLTVEHVKPDGGSLEDGWLAGVVPAVWSARVLDDEVAARLCPVLCHHSDPAPAQSSFCTLRTVHCVHCVHCVHFCYLKFLC